MSLSQRYGIFAVKIDPDSFVSPLQLNGIVETPLRYGVNVEGEALAGDVFPRFKSVTGYRRSAQFRSKHIRDALSNVGVTGVAIVSSTNTGLTFYAQKRAAGSTRASGSVHRSYNFSDGILVPTRLTANHQSDAEITYEAFTVSPDGTTDPLTVTNNAALPGTIADNGRFTLGPITLGGTALTGFESVDIEFNVDVPLDGSDSDLYDTLASIENIDPVITIRGLDELTVDTITKAGLAVTHANSEIYLRKRDNSGTYVADGTAEHVKFTFDGIAVLDESLSGQPRVGPSIRINTRYDGTNSPITVTTDTAIT